MVERVLVTDAALELIEKLTRTHGKLMFHQSGGCCDGSSPMCYPAGEFRVGGKSRPRDLHFDDVFGAQPREHPPPAFPRRRVPLEEVGVERQGDATGKQDPVGPGAHQVRLE